MSEDITTVGDLIEKLKQFDPHAEVMGLAGCCKHCHDIVNVSLAEDVDGEYWPQEDGVVVVDIRD